jgi:D-proline reductase (dithiol) PrdB
MQVDSYRFLPRSFTAMYASVEPAAGDTEAVWAPFEKRLAEARIGLLTSAGLYLAGKQQTFDGEREKQEPTWGDPSWRALPHDVGDRKVGMMHLHVNSTDILADHNVALPTDVLDELVAEQRVGGTTARHAAVMGYQQAGLEVWRNETGPEIAAMLKEDGADGVVLAPV